MARHSVDPTFDRPSPGKTVTEILLENGHIQISHATSRRSERLKTEARR